MKTSYLFLFLFLPFFMAGQTNISGTWKGIITQNEGGYRSNYDMELVLKQDGNKVTGRSTVRVDDIYAIMDLEGEIISDGYFRFQERQIIEAKTAESLEWCIKRGQLLLKFEEDEVKLEGFWQGMTSFSACIPGKIFLKRSVSRA